MNYRIKEYQKLFYIQVYEKEVITSGYLWWEKTKIIPKWTRVDNRGIGLFSMRYLSNLDKVLDGFETLEEAKEQIEIFKSEPKYYY